MEIRQLRYFIALAEELHFRKAALRLSISQPPLSSAIKQMESELGTELFERTTKTVALTAAGRAFYPEAQRTLAQFELALSVARRTGRGAVGQLRLGYTGGMLLRGLPQLMQAYEKAEEGVEVSLREMGSAAQADAILHRRLAAGFLHASVLPPTLDHVTVQREPFVCCLPAGHALAARKRIGLRSLADADWILFARDTSPSYFDSVIALTTQAGFSPRIRHEVTHWISAVMLVMQGCGVAVVPASFATAGLPGVCFLRLVEQASDSLAHLAWRRGDDDPALLRFVAHVRGWYGLPV